MNSPLWSEFERMASIYRREPRLYDDERHVAALVYATERLLYIRSRLQYVLGDEPHFLTAALDTLNRGSQSNYFDFIHDHPWCYGLTGGVTYTEIIEAITGYRVFCTSDPVDAGHWFFGSVSLREALKLARPARSGGFARSWYYGRDLFAAMMPRKRCFTCDEKVGRWAIRCAAFTAGPRLYCSRKCHELSAAVRCRVCGAPILPVARGADWNRCRVHSLWPQGCDASCRRFEATQRFASLTRREVEKWREHVTVPTCSPACHREVEVTYRCLTLDALEKRKWIETGRAAIAAVLEKLPPGYRRGRKASRSPNEESTPPATSAT